MLTATTEREVNDMYSLYETCVLNHVNTSQVTLQEMDAGYNTISIAMQFGDAPPDVYYDATVIGVDNKTMIGEFRDSNKENILGVDYSGDTIHLTELDGKDWRVVIYNSNNQPTHEFVSTFNLKDDVSKEITVTYRRNVN